MAQKRILERDASSGRISEGVTADTYFGGTVPANSTDLVNAQSVQQETTTYAADTGAANAYVVTLTPAMVLVIGSQVTFKAANGNTTASTLNVNGTGVINLVKFGGTALVSGDIVAGQIITAVYDGTNWQMTSPPLITANSPVGTTVSTGSSSYTAGQVKNFSLTMAKSWISWKVTEATGQAFWLRLYSTSAARSADANRPFTVPLALGTQHGCLLDLYIDQSVAVTPWMLSPPIVGSNDDSTQGTTIYASVTNIASTTQNINVTVSYVQTES